MDLNSIDPVAYAAERAQVIPFGIRVNINRRVGRAKRNPSMVG